MRNLAISLLAVAFVLPGVARADFLSTKNTGGVFASQTSVLDKRASLKSKRSLGLDSGKVRTPTKWGSSEPYDGSYRGRYLDMARAAAQRHGVPADLFLRLVQQESAWRPTAESHKGAIGLAQLMPDTARRLRVDPHDPYENLDGGARYLATQYRRFGSWRLALAAYNAGPEAVRKHGGIPPYRETRNYVRIIMGS
ncbi:lytic transglycosylase domain-containing protein [Roseovarius salinarum]|uniref:lytic transglycosylase domain-containing protein n=1 Tax=Roseovarius salinarum TaxID=1981892 RepID=UPI000C34D914|nr:lytic transglycosylase domain-containing protein [Roseovarius salinarum]